MFLVPLSSGLVLNPSPLLRAGGYDVRPCALVMGVGGDEATRDPEDDASMFQEYLKSRGSAELEQVEEGYRSFKGIDQEFDGGDSGGGVVGDGNTDLEDQHNSATLGALRGGIADYSGASDNVGRGNVKTLVENDEFHGTVKGDTSSRTASAGANYFGRSTGLAEKLINEGFSEHDVKYKRMDKVRAQQKENWFNQRAIHKQNRAQGQGVVFGEETGGRPSEGGYIAREALNSNAWRKGSGENEISQRDLASHLQDLANKAAPRLDGEPWGPLTEDKADSVETFEVRSSPRQTHVTEIMVRNDYNTFAPYICDLLPGSSPSYTVTPNHGSMNRRSGEPINLVVRFTPQDTGTHEATVVFETEDMKKVYKFIGST